MSHPALIDAVRKTAADAVAAVWSEARADAARQRDAVARSVDEQRAALGRQLQDVAARAQAAATRDAERQARRIRTAAKAALADRLRALAAAALPRLRDDDYAARFQALAGELPDREWARVTVNPDDVALARRFFPASEIATAASLGGGVIAEAGGLRVDNSFDARLSAAWPQIAPAVLHDVLQQGQCSQPAA